MSPCFLILSRLFSESVLVLEPAAGGHPSHQPPGSPFYKEYPDWQGCLRLKSPSYRLPEESAGRHWVLVSQLPCPKHMATFLHLLLRLLLTRATAWLLEWRGQRLGHCQPRPGCSELAQSVRVSKVESRGAFPQPQNNIETEGGIPLCLTQGACPQAQSAL